MSESSVPIPAIRRLSADDLYLEQVEEARHAPLEQKFRAGPRLFDRACIFMRAGIQMQFPDASESDIERILRERLELARRLEEGA